MIKSGCGETASLCVVGPNPALHVSGGVATHLRILSSLNVFAQADFCDVGSLNGPRRASVVEIFAGFRNFRLRCRGAKCVMTNVSISSGSLLKLCLQLFFLPKKHSRVVFVFFHGGHFQRLGSIGNLIGGILKVLAPRVDAFFFLTEEQRQSFLKVVGNYPTRKYRNFSGSDAQLPRIPHGDVCRLLYVGRITEAKGVFESLAALEILHKEMPGRFQLVFVGDGDAVPELRSRLADDLEKFVEFKGYLEGEVLEKEYQSADLVLLPSSHEGFPYVFIEAMRAGTPMIATPVGALPELIREGENGYIVSQTSDALARKIRAHAASSERHAVMHEHCYRCFSETLGKKSAEEFYRSLLADRFV